MIQRSCLLFKPNNHRDSLIWSLYEKYGGGRPFSEFAKDIIYEIALLTHNGKAQELVSLSINGETVATEKPVQRKSSKKKTAAKASVKTPVEPNDENGNGEKEDDKTLSSEDILGVGNFN